MHSGRRNQNAVLYSFFAFRHCITGIKGVMEVRSDDVRVRRTIQKARLLPFGEGNAKDTKKNQKAADDLIEKQRLFQEYYAGKNGHKGAQMMEDTHGGSLQFCEGEVCQHGGKERGGNPKKENGKKVAIGAQSHLV